MNQAHCKQESVPMAPRASQTDELSSIIERLHECNHTASSIAEILGEPVIGEFSSTPKTTSAPNTRDALTYIRELAHHISQQLNSIQAGL